jgi:hypothetical protein
MNPNCVDRRDSIVAPQALHLMNTGMVQELSEGFAQRIAQHAGTDPVRQIELAYWVALGRAPTDEEKDIGLGALRKLTLKWGEELAKAGKPDQGAAALKALTTYCHTIMNSAAFLYVD